eukprot:TRINITY_DN3702_c0_g1_i3.p1 TRINITY_DN3702_c0_g1~~TRINITY_DN3702_c0_g1_i3.p1  ORF type:complete len:236 (+),score=30.62 TRINITY_DN3702_c0_g1_i3:72-779(+)
MSERTLVQSSQAQGHPSTEELSGKTVSETMSSVTVRGMTQSCSDVEKSFCKPETSQGYSQVDSSVSYPRVGDKYQAVIPPLERALNNRESRSCYGQLMWDPSVLSAKKVDRYLASVKLVSCHESVSPVGEALDVLHSCSYDVKKAQMEWDTRGLLGVNSINEEFDIDVEAFEEANQRYPKQFHIIRLLYFPNKTTSELVRFYFYWKLINKNEASSVCVPTKIFLFLRLPSWNRRP